MPHRQPDRPGPLRRLKYRIEYGLFLVVVGLLRLMPLDMASAVMGRTWRVLAPLSRRQQRVLGNLELAMPEKSAAERRAIALGAWENLGRVFAETLQLDRIVADKENRFSWSEEGVANRFGTDSDHIVLVSLHLGNWEAVILPAVAAGVKPVGVYREVKNPLVDDYLRRKRMLVFPHGLLSKGHDTAQTLLGHLRRTGSVALVGDLRESKGIDVSFFGHTASATYFPAMLARHCRVPLVAGRCVRTEGVHFRIDTAPIDYPVTGDRTADVAAATQAIHDVFEGWIRETPAQWMWVQRKWWAGRSRRRQSRHGEGTGVAAGAVEGAEMDPLRRDTT
ncbi:lysophospholipid acyltransferase family protein [Rhodobium gokarnense]|uniref:KDO2-lipid IV(A) lauroyltransferase n=1 Tax=Rhodobium gokarnense TaxID=364296 RepID=A0ABT3H5Q5_9HYPH|nr:lauroyl acyltransferase [Rhodobium gokarnense]MCW2305723.1 KDO2-lipid IV(A) lauroyltransferase [Rhodobium gokarnense]